VIMAQAKAGASETGPTKSIWTRLEQVGVPASAQKRVPVGVQHFDWSALFDKPSLFTDQIIAKMPAARNLVKVHTQTMAFEFLSAVGGANGEIKRIDPKRVRSTANWDIGETDYWLVQEDYQAGNSATPNTQYMHLISAKPGSAAKIIDLSTQLQTDGTLKK